MRVTLIKIILRGLSWLPFPVAHGVGQVIGWGLYLFPTASRRVAQINLALCYPQLDAPSRAKLLRQNLIETGKIFAESGVVWLASPRRVLRLIKQVSGEEHVRAAQARGQGVIIVSPHLGSWEMIGLYYSTRWPMTILYRPPRLSALDDLMRHARERCGARLAPTDASGVRALYRTLAAGETMGILPDQEPSQGSGVFAPFFGVPAYTMVLLARLAARSHASVIFAVAERLPYGRGFHLRFIPSECDVAANDLAQATACLNAGVEQCVALAPAQYLWSYKRFRTRPAGDAPVY